MRLRSVIGYILYEFRRLFVRKKKTFYFTSNRQQSVTYTQWESVCLLNETCFGGELLLNI